LSGAARQSEKRALASASAVPRVAAAVEAVVGKMAEKAALQKSTQKPQDAAPRFPRSEQSETWDRALATAKGSPA
jgi:hypothetical protein